MGLCFSLREIRKLYNYFFVKEPPERMPYEHMLRILVDEVGEEHLLERVKLMRMEETVE